MRSAFFWDVTQLIVVVPYRRFEKKYRCIFKGQEILLGFTDPFKMRPIGCSETSVRIYTAQYPRRAEILSTSGRKPEFCIRRVQHTVAYFITSLSINYSCVWNA